MSFVFISYSRQDEKIAENLCSYLAENEIKYWIDTSRIIPASEWDVSIDNALREAFCCLLILTSNSNDSDYVKYEWAFMRGTDKPVLPLLCENYDEKQIETPITLQKINRIDCTNGFSENVAQQIKKFLSEDPTNRFVSVAIHYRLALPFSVIQFADILINTSNELSSKDTLTFAKLLYSLVWSTITELQTFWLTYSHAFTSYHKTSINRFVKILTHNSLRGMEHSDEGAKRYWTNITDAWRLDLREMYINNIDSVHGDVSTFGTYPPRFNPSKNYNFSTEQLELYTKDLMNLLSQYEEYHSDIYEIYNAGVLALIIPSLMNSILSNKSDSE